MNVASLENCKKLYELSGWEDAYAWWNFSDDAPEEDPTPKRTWYLQYGSDGWGARCPAYDLGYLLRKLPGHIGDEFLDMCWYGDGWEFAYQRSRRGLWNAQIGSHHAKTPEDAAALLAIELFEQGILRKED